MSEPKKIDVPPPTPALPPELAAILPPELVATLTPEQIAEMVQEGDADAAAPLVTATPAEIEAAGEKMSPWKVAALGRRIAATKNDYGVAALVHSIYKGQIAFFGGHMWMRVTGNSWKIVSNLLKHRLLSTFKEFRPQHYKALCHDARVDIMTECEPVCYYTRPHSEQYRCWEPLTGVQTSDVVFRNGKLNMATGAFTPLPEDQLVFGLLVAHDYDPALLGQLKANDFTGAPAEFMTLMDNINYALAAVTEGKIVDRPEVVAYFRQVVAQILRPHVLYPFFVHVLGESGARKTTTMRALLSAPCGPSALSEIAESLLSEKFMKVGLVNKIANLSNDSEKSARFVTFIKEYTSGVIQTERKFQDCETTRVTAKLFATLNEAQALADSSKGLENRFVCFLFNSRESENDRSAAGTRWMDPAAYGEECRRWTTHWLLAGLAECFVSGAEKLPVPPETVLAWREDVLREGDPVRKFVSEHLEFGKDYSVRAADLREAVAAGYANAANVEKFLVDLGKYIKMRHPEVTKKKAEKEMVGEDGEKKRHTWQVWAGMRLK